MIVLEKKIRQAIIAGTLGYSRGIIFVNYERIFKKQNNLIYTIGSGVGYTPGLKESDNRQKGSVYLPLFFSMLIGKQNNYLQVGMSYTAAFGPNYIDSLSVPPTIYRKFESAYIFSIGYRYFHRNGAIVQAYPLLQWTNNPSTKFSLGFGLAIGGAF